MALARAHLRNILAPGVWIRLFLLCGEEAGRSTLSLFEMHAEWLHVSAIFYKAALNQAVSCFCPVAL